MSSSHQKRLTFFQHNFFLFLIAVSIVVSQVKAKKRGLNNSISAILVFGDSTVDPGNNNYVMTPFKSNFPPYGRDFPGQNPTGRFTNGRLATDFNAKYVGIKEFVPPYLDPTLSNEELLTGVSFASAASGFDPLTPKISNVISISKQLEYFKEYQKRLEQIIGKTRTKTLINNALYLVSAGTNDFVINYFTLPIRQKQYTLPNYMEFLLQQVQQFMQGLWDQGARKIAVFGLSPMGCLPLVITMKPDNANLKRGCVEYFSSVAKDFNIMLENELNAMQLSLANYGARIGYIDTYGTFSDIIQGHKFDYDEVSSGCCGSGLLETSYLCNPKSFVCADASKYVFWDSIHPTEKTYYTLFEAHRSKIDFIIQD